MRRHQRLTLTQVTIAIALSLLLLIAIGVKPLQVSRSVSSNAGLVTDGGTLSSYLAQFCLNATPSQTHSINSMVNGFSYTTTGEFYGFHNATTPASCTYQHWGELTLRYNNSAGGALQDELLSDFETYSATTVLAWFAPLVGTGLPALEEFKFTNVSGNWNALWCPSGTCGGSAPSGSGSASSPACSISGSYSTGVLGWGYFLNQCAWQQIYTDLCSGSWMGWNDDLVFGILAIIFGGDVGAALTAVLGLSCAALWALEQNPNGNTIIGYTGSSCWWQYVGPWPWSWNWLCVTYTVTLGIWPGGPPWGY